VGQDLRHIGEHDPNLVHEASPVSTGRGFSVVGLQAAG
jgi:ribosomal protein L13E